MGKRDRWELLGDFIRTQRELTNLSLRRLADLAKISNPYLSQIERGLYKPSAEVLKSLAEALGIAPEKLFEMAGFLDQEEMEARWKPGKDGKRRPAGRGGPGWKGGRPGGGFGGPGGRADR